MQGTREQFDADRTDTIEAYSQTPYGIYQHNLNCSNCNQSLYVDKETYKRVLRSIEEGLDNPFLCDECQSEYEDLAHTH
jgi:hypothetical protein